jgi:hypothetical protein
MAVKTYFLKTSWIDERQPLRREHRNATCDLDLTTDYYHALSIVAKEVFGEGYTCGDNFTIDFMIETGEV